MTQIMASINKHQADSAIAKYEALVKQLEDYFTTAKDNAQRDLINEITRAQGTTPLVAVAMLAALRGEHIGEKFAEDAARALMQTAAKTAHGEKANA